MHSSMCLLQHNYQFCLKTNISCIKLGLKIIAKYALLSEMLGVRLSLIDRSQKSNADGADMTYFGRHPAVTQVINIVRSCSFTLSQ